MTSHAETGNAGFFGFLLAVLGFAVIVVKALVEVATHYGWFGLGAAMILFGVVWIVITALLRTLLLRS